MSNSLPDAAAYKARHKQPFWGTFSVSILIHAGIVVLLGGVVVFKTLERPPAQFKPPPPTPPVVRIEPRKLEYKVKMQEQQKRSGRPTVSPRLTANGISTMALPEIKVDMEAIKERVKATFKTSGISGSGTGFGTGSGNGMGELGLGVGGVQISMFNIKERVERVAIIIDVSKSMVHDEKGGLAGFASLKRKIAEVINTLNEGVFFNIIMVGEGIDVCNPKLVLANAETKEAGVQFLEGYMNDLDHVGVLDRSFKPDHVLPNQGGETRHDMALAAAFESGAETIFLISDGNHFIYKEETPEQKQKREEDALKRNGGAEAVEKAREAFVKREAEDAARRAKQGLPPRVREHYGFGITEPPMYTAEDVLDYLKTLYNELYKAQGKKPPRIHCIAFQTSPSEEVFMKAVAHEYRGRFEKITIRDLGVKALEAR